MNSSTTTTSRPVLAAYGSYARTDYAHSPAPAPPAPAATAAAATAIADDDQGAMPESVFQSQLDELDGKQFDDPLNEKQQHQARQALAGERKGGGGGGGRQTNRLPTRAVIRNSVAGYALQ